MVKTTKYDFPDGAKRVRKTLNGTDGGLSGIFRRIPKNAGTDAGEGDTGKPLLFGKQERVAIAGGE
jgi:hypothetical protein